MGSGEWEAGEAEEGVLWQWSHVCAPGVPNVKAGSARLSKYFFILAA